MGDVATIDGAFAPEPWPEVASVVLDGEAVLFDERTGRVHHLNPSGTLVWQLLDGSTSVDTIADAIGLAAGTAPASVRDDVVALVTMLAELGVLVGFDPAAVEPPSP